MPMTPAAAKKYKPRRTPESLNEVIYPETRAKMEEAKAEVADRKAASDNEAAYDLSSRMSMNEVFDKKAKGGYVKKMASGGSASSRADGIAVRGKTRGTMC
jgi:electron transfer flavoprotein alpha/beta subunit